MCATGALIPNRDGCAATVQRRPSFRRDAMPCRPPRPRRPDTRLPRARLVHPNAAFTHCANSTMRHLYSEAATVIYVQSAILGTATMKRRNFLVVLGGIAAAPFPAWAQQKTAPVIGFLSSGSQTAFAPFAAAFRSGLEGQGLKYEQDVLVEYRWSDGRYENLKALADDLVQRKVTLIVASGGVVSARAALQATKTIPI